MELSPLATLLLSIVGSSAAFGFLQFIIQRHDKKHDKFKELTDRLDEMDNKIDGVSTQVTKMHSEMDAGFAAAKVDSEAGDKKIMETINENEALHARLRILSASDELRRNVEHSEEFFDQLNEDIDTYERYCADHPKFKNNKAVNAIAYINDVYHECQKKNKFL